MFIGVTLGVGNVIPVGWSMEVMMLFYVILPGLLLLILKCSRPLLILGVTILIVTGSRIAYLHMAEVSASRVFLDTYQGLPTSVDAKLLYYHPWFRLPPFLIGMGLAVMLHKKSAQTLIPPKYGIGYLGLIMMLVCCFSPVHLENSWLYDLPETILTVYFGATITLFSLGLSMVMWNPLVFGAGWVRPIGKFCSNVSNCIFGIYLFHMPFLVIAAIIVLGSTDKVQLLTIAPFQAWLIFALTAVFAIVFANLLLRFIENPITSWLRRVAA